MTKLSGSCPTSTIINPASYAYRFSKDRYGTPTLSRKAANPNPSKYNTKGLPPGTYARLLKSPYSPYSADQPAFSRVVMAYLARAWPMNANQAAWIAMAPTWPLTNYKGESKTYTGFEFYMWAARVAMYDRLAHTHVGYLPDDFNATNFYPSGPPYPTQVDTTISTLSLSTDGFISGTLTATFTGFLNYEVLISTSSPYTGKIGLAPRQVPYQATSIDIPPPQTTLFFEGNLYFESPLPRNRTTVTIWTLLSEFPIGPPATATIFPA
jgi:hypothetical protein